MLRTVQDDVQSNTLRVSAVQSTSASSENLQDIRLPYGPPLLASGLQQGHAISEHAAQPQAQVVRGFSDDPLEHALHPTASGTRMVRRSLRRSRTMDRDGAPPP